MCPYNLNFGLMVLIKVYANWDALQGNHCLLERQIPWDNSVRFPVEEIRVALKTMYGSKAVILTIFD